MVTWLGAAFWESSTYKTFEVLVLSIRFWVYIIIKYSVQELVVKNEEMLMVLARGLNGIEFR